MQEREGRLQVLLACMRKSSWSMLYSRIDASAAHPHHHIDTYNRVSVRASLCFSFCLCEAASPWQAVANTVPSPLNLPQKMEALCWSSMLQPGRQAGRGKGG